MLGCEISIMLTNGLGTTALFKINVLGKIAALLGPILEHSSKLNFMAHTSQCHHIDNSQGFFCVCTVQHPDTNS